MRVALSLSVDVTVIVQGWHIIRLYNKIVGGSSPNHCLDIGDKLNRDGKFFERIC